MIATRGSTRRRPSRPRRGFTMTRGPTAQHTVHVVGFALEKRCLSVGCHEHPGFTTTTVNNTLADSRHAVGEARRCFQHVRIRVSWINHSRRGFHFHRMFDCPFAFIQVHRHKSRLPQVLDALAFSMMHAASLGGTAAETSCQTFLFLATAPKNTTLL